MFNIDMYNFKNGSVVLYKNLNNSGEVIIYKNKKVFFRKYYIDFDNAYNVFLAVTQWLEREIKDTIKATLLAIKKEFNEVEREEEKEIMEYIVALSYIESVIDYFK